MSALIILTDWLVALPATLDSKLRLSKGNKDGSPSPVAVTEYELPEKGRDELAVRVLEAARLHAEDRAVDATVQSSYSYCLCIGKSKKAPHVRFRVDVHGPIVVPMTDAGITRESLKTLFIGLKDLTAESKRREKASEDHAERIIGWYRTAFADMAKAKGRSDRRLTLNQRALNDFARALAAAQDKSEIRKAETAIAAKLTDVEIEMVKHSMKGSWMEDMIEKGAQAKFTEMISAMGTPMPSQLPAGGESK